MENPIKPAKLAAAKSALTAALAELVPDFVEFPADIVLKVAQEAVNSGVDSKVRFEMGLDDVGKVVGFVTPTNRNSKLIGETLDSGAPCPPWCPPE